ncbi:replication-relaxation family protein [Radiobacillus sp. PE A8.2]|uniref:replication-relaxation family protein n=1 Tax=Radiobacillus sp. PE A8.2 TaxID=3380349 RepID=UPI0038904484
MSLSRLEVLSRDMIAELLGVGIKRTNIIMREINSSGNVSFIDNPKGRIFKLSKRGAAIFDVNYLHGWSLLEHRLMRNWTLIHENEYSLEEMVKIGDISVVPDAVIKGDKIKFIEIDRKQKWKANVNKLERYAALKETGAFQKQYGYYPRLIWIVEMESRIDKIKKCCSELDLPIEVFHVGEIKSVSNR